jgi:acyl carrier protein
MSQRADIEAFILDYLARQAPLPADAEMAQFNFYKSGHVDSFGLMRLIVALEDRFDVELSDEALSAANVTNVSGLTRAVLLALGAAEANHAA